MKNSNPTEDLGSEVNYKSTENLRLTKKESEDEDIVTPLVWVPLSLFIAVILAISNNLACYLSDYGFKLRYLMSPGWLFANVLALFVISHNDWVEFDKKYISNNSDASEEDPGVEKIDQKQLFNWFYNIYFRKRIEVIKQRTKKQKREVKTKLTIRWARVWVTFILCILNVLQYWIFIEGYYMAKQVNLNSGVIMSLTCIKPLLTAFVFYFMFNQRVSIYHFLGILLSCIWIGMIAMSHGRLSTEDYDMYLIYSIMLLLGSIILLWVSTVVMKYYFDFRNNNVNIPAFVNFFNLIIDVIFLVIFIIEYWLFEGYPMFDLFLAQITGFLWSTATFLIVYVSLRGKKGPSEALIETCVIYQTIIDSIFFFRIPNYTQLMGVAFGLLATLVIMLADSKNK